MENFGFKVKQLRQERHMTREDFCEDEAELSVRQLARIESGVSLPTLNKVYYIANRLQVSVGDLTEGNNFDVPERYKELKHNILRIPTYADDERLKEREEQFDEIYNDYYDNLPEEEKLIIDCIQARLDVTISNDINFGEPLLEEYFEQVKRKKLYRLNELILIDLYLVCIMVSSFDEKIYQEVTFNKIVRTALKRSDKVLAEEALFLCRLIIGFLYIYISLKKLETIEELISICDAIMQRGQDFQQLPILRLMEWKFYLNCQDDFDKAKASYERAVMFASMIGDTALVSRLEKEWQKDIDK